MVTSRLNDSALPVRLATPAPGTPALTGHLPVYSRVPVASNVVDETAVMNGIQWSWLIT
jgi:hypothetical protein